MRRPSHIGSQFVKTLCTNFVFLAQGLRLPLDGHPGGMGDSFKPGVVSLPVWSWGCFGYMVGMPTFGWIEPLQNPIQFNPIQCILHVASTPCVRQLPRSKEVVNTGLILAYWFALQGLRMLSKPGCLKVAELPGPRSSNRSLPVLSCCASK